MKERRISVGIPDDLIDYDPTGFLSRSSLVIFVSFFLRRPFVMVVILDVNPEMSSIYFCIHDLWSKLEVLGLHLLWNVQGSGSCRWVSVNQRSKRHDKKKDIRLTLLLKFRVTLTSGLCNLMLVNLKERTSQSKKSLFDPFLLWKKQEMENPGEVRSNKSKRGQNRCSESPIFVKEKVKVFFYFLGSSSRKKKCILVDEKFNK